MGYVWPVQRILVVVAALTLFVTGCRTWEYSDVQECLLGRPSAASLQQAAYVPGEVLVRYEPGIILSAFVLEPHGMTVLEAGRDGLPDLVGVTGDAAEAAARLAADPRILNAEPNWLVYTQQDCHSDSWHLVDAGIVPALRHGPGPHEAVVAVIDTGVDIDHPDLAEATLPGRNFYRNAPDPDDPRPDAGDGAAHGTHVAGIVAARGNSRAVGIAGFPESVRILPIRIFDGSEPNPVATMNDLLAAMSYVTNARGVPRADIINLSVGFSGTSRELGNAVRSAHEAGILVVAAAGNNGTSVFAPANSQYAVAVGSVDHGYRRSAFSNFGGSGLSVMAPGGRGPSSCGSVLSTLPGGIAGCRAGTSMAAPLVAGAAALLLTHEPRLTPDELRARLEQATFFDSSYMTATEYGNGVLCVDRLLQGRNPQPAAACR